MVEAFDTRGAVTLQRFRSPWRRATARRNSATSRPPSRAEGDRFVFQLVAFDEDIDPLTYWADGLPAGATFDPATRTFSWTMDFDSAGTLRCQLLCQRRPRADRDGGHVADRARPASRLTSSSRPSRDPPRATPCASSSTSRRTSERGAVVLERGLPFGMVLNPGTGEFEWTPTLHAGGQLHGKLHRR